MWFTRFCVIYLLWCCMKFIINAVSVEMSRRYIGPPLKNYFQQGVELTVLLWIEHLAGPLCFAQGWTRHFTLTVPPLHPVNWKATRGYRDMQCHSTQRDQQYSLLRKTGVNFQRFCVTMIAQPYLFSRRFCFMLSVFPTGYIGVIRGIFVGSAFLWITSSLVSKNKLKPQWSITNAPW